MQMCFDGRVHTLDMEATSRLFITSNFSACSEACLYKVSFSASCIRREASGTRMPLGSCQLSGAGSSFASEAVRLRDLLLVLRTGRPRSITDDSDKLRLCKLCEAIGSRLSILGEPRCSHALDGDPALNGFDIADRGVGSAPCTLGDRRFSKALMGVMPPGVAFAGVVSCDRLDFVLSLRGLGEPLRSAAGDLGGTSGRDSTSSWMTSVSTFKAGFDMTPGLRIGDSGFPKVTDGSKRLGCSGEEKKKECSSCAGEGPVTQDIRASPKGPALQFGPGALLDRSWPKTSVDAFRRGGRPGMVAVLCQRTARGQMAR
jgi:hypothetical protein